MHEENVKRVAFSKLVCHPDGGCYGCRKEWEGAQFQGRIEMLFACACCDRCVILRRDCWKVAGLREEASSIVALMPGKDHIKSSQQFTRGARPSIDFVGQPPNASPTGTVSV